MRRWMTTAAIAVLLGAAAAGAAWAALTQEERNWAHRVADEAVLLRDRADARLNDPLLEEGIRGEVQSVRDAAAEIERLMRAVETGR